MATCATCATDNCVGDDGATAVADALKENTTLTTLDLECACCSAPPPTLSHCHADAHVVIGRMARRLSTRRTSLHAPMAACAPRAAGNQVGDDGATAVADALKENATLTTLDLGCA
jgi:hypothetical protein